MAVERSTAIFYILYACHAARLSGKSIDVRVGNALARRMRKAA
ncbi:hypothetical protein X772_25675 [Mesorhizobium sp. LSJC280B00]|nr:hypothetical protein X772_25675 [Mesorhizobium sp. LSJC280B00]